MDKELVQEAYFGAGRANHRATVALIVASTALALSLLAIVTAFR